MLVHSAKSKRALFSARTAAFLVVFVLMSGCSDSGMFSPNTGGGARLALRPFLSANVSYSVMADISRIRVTARQQPGGEVVKTQVFPVNANDEEWNLDLELPANGVYEILLELLSVGSNNSETVEYSGKLTVEVTSGPQTTPAPVPLVVGPPQNLNITSISIDPREADLLEGDNVTLKATVAGTTSPTIIWSSSNSNIASVDQSGKVTAKIPGQVKIKAAAGTKDDEATVRIGARATKIDITPSAPTITSLGADVTLNAVVRDARNQEVPGLQITWSIADEEVATPMGAGVFRGRKNGSTEVTATTVQRGRTITEKVTLKVEQQAASVTIDPASASFSALGETETFKAEAKDANGNALKGVSFEWSSSAENVATVSAAGLVTARGNGTAKIKVTAAGGSAEATVKVEQEAADVVLSPRSATLKSINETVQLEAKVTDARGNEMNVPVEYSTTDKRIAQVDDKGLVTAKGDGQTTIRAQVGTQRSSMRISVERVVASVTISPSEAAVDAGEYFQFTGSALDANGFKMPDAEITWESNNTSIATVDNTGKAYGISQGDATITARSAGKAGTAVLKVEGSISGNLRPNSNGKVLVYHADYSNSEITSKLAATGFFSTGDISYHAMGCTPPSLADLSAYGALLVYTNSKPCNAAAHGDLLKQYVDAGGKVVLAVYSFSTFYDRGWSMEGGIMNSGYSPFVITPDQLVSGSPWAPFYGRTLKFSTAVTTHPILTGVADFTYDGNTNYSKVVLASGATLVANDQDDIPLIAVNASGSVVGINVFPTGFAKSDGVWRAFANALK